MTTLMIKDLTASKELDSKAMAAVAGGTSALPLLILDYTSVSTSFPVDNRSLQIGAQSNSTGSFNTIAATMTATKGSKYKKAPT